MKRKGKESTKHICTKTPEVSPRRCCKPHSVELKLTCGAEVINGIDITIEPAGACVSVLMLKVSSKPLGDCTSEAWSRCHVEPSMAENS